MARNGYSVLDGHHHVGSLELVMDRWFKPVTDVSPEEAARQEVQNRLDTMDSTGVDQAIVMPGHLYLRANGLPDTQLLNENIAQYRDRNPDRFPAAVGIVEPLYGDAGLDELDRIKEDLGLVGVVFHARFQGVPSNSPLIVRLLERMAEVGLLPWVHALTLVPDEALWRIQELARAVPETPIVVLDAFHSESALEVLPVAKATPNLLLDTSFANNSIWLDVMASEIGSQRLVFGTDVYSDFHPHAFNATLEHVLEMKVSDEEKQGILGGNLKQLLSIG
jgi:predicted TIM-barrel fold metal-dependent hydrolase